MTKGEQKVSSDKYERTYVHTYGTNPISPHHFVVRGDNKRGNNETIR